MNLSIFVIIATVAVIAFVIFLFKRERIVELVIAAIVATVALIMLPVVFDMNAKEVETISVYEVDSVEAVNGTYVVKYTDENNKTVTVNSANVTSSDAATMIAKVRKEWGFLSYTGYSLALGR